MRRTGFVVLGSVMIGLGVAIAPLPGPGGVPVMAIGLGMVLRNSPRAKRRFVKLQRRHPRVVSPVRGLLRRFSRVR